jgi:TPR repeat protein
MMHRRQPAFLPALRAACAACLLAAGLVGNATAGNNEDFAAAGAAYVRGDYETALKLMRPLAEAGIVGAQFNLGLMYASGHGVPQDLAEAVKWWRKAADVGNAKAQLSLGLAYGAGRGVPQDFGEAMRWSRRAADQGDAGGQVAVAAMYELGQGVPQDYAEAMKWYRYAAGLGSAAGFYGVAVLYAEGRGVAANEAEALKWFEKAAEKGDPRAKPGIAYLYARSARRFVAARQYPRAVEDLGRAIRFADANPAYYNELAWLLATADTPSARNGPRAVELALKASGLSQWKEPAVLDTLAAAYARTGDFAKAVEWQEKAIGGAPLSQEDEKMVRLRLYREGKAFPPN